MDDYLDYFVTQYKSLKEQEKHYKQQAEDLRVEYKDSIMAHGDYTSAAGKITIRPATVRVSYDKKKIEKFITELMDIDVKLAQKLAAMREETNIDATFQVE